LRERGNDVLLLADHFLGKFSREFGKPGWNCRPRRATAAATTAAGKCAKLQNTLERR